MPKPKMEQHLRIRHFQNKRTNKSEICNRIAKRSNSKCISVNNQPLRMNVGLLRKMKMPNNGQQSADLGNSLRKKLSISKYAVKTTSEHYIIQKSCQRNSQVKNNAK